MEVVDIADNDYFFLQGCFLYRVRRADRKVFTLTFSTLLLNRETIAASVPDFVTATRVSADAARVLVREAGGVCSTV